MSVGEGSGEERSREVDRTLGGLGQVGGSGRAVSRGRADYSCDNSGAGAVAAS